jgi:tRNA A-37 threonylcarbamoyl transferase component Bud32
MLRRLLLFPVARVILRIQSRRQARETAVRAGEALSRVRRRPVSLRIVQSFGATLRCAVLAGGPETVIVKRVRPKGRQRYDPAEAAPLSMAYRLFNEWAGIELLTRAGVATPGLLAADRERGFLIEEDFGDRGFDELLMADDPGAARSAALQYAVALGRLHAATRGREEEYLTLRDRLGPRTTDPREAWGTREWFADALPVLRDVLAGLGLPSSDELERELAKLEESVAEPGSGFRVYTHGDPGPDNLRLADGRAMLIDFEYGGFRHAFLDAAFVRMLLPTSWRVNRLPEDLVEEMEAVYRRELAAGVPEAAADDRFAAALLDGCAFWLVMTLVQALRRREGREGNSILEQDQAWGLSSLRQIVLGRLRVFHELAGRRDGYPALAATCRQLEERLGERWHPLAELPLFPAFRAAQALGGPAAVSERIS